MKQIRCLPLLALALVSSACSILPAEKIDDLPLEERSRRVTRQVARIRDLSLEHEVPVAVKSKDELRAVMEREVNEIWPQEGAGLERAYKVLGLVPKDLDLQPFMVDFLKESVAGYYDPEKKEFFTIDRDEKDEEKDDGFDIDARLVLPHELVHAIDDQHFDLEGIEEAGDFDDDQSSAFSALVEGSAMEAGMEHVLWSVGWPGSVAGPLLSPFVEQLSDFAAIDLDEVLEELDDEEAEKMRKAPPVVFHSMMFPYIQGWAFTNRIRREFGWRGVDAAYADPPESTEQILFPERYIDRRDRPVAIQLPAPPFDWKEVHQETLGMLATKILLSTRLDSDAADDIDGWDGDRFAVWETPEGDAIGWLLVFDHRADADDFETTYSVLLRHNLGEDDSWAVLREEDRVAVVQGAPRGQAEEAARHLFESEVTRHPDDQAPDRWYWDVLRFPIGLRMLDRAFEAKLLGGIALDYRIHQEGHRFELLNSLLLRTENTPDRTALWAGLGLVGFTSDRTVDYTFGRIPGIFNWHGRGQQEERSSSLSVGPFGVAWAYDNVRLDQQIEMLWGILFKLKWGPKSRDGERLRILFIPIPGV